MQSMTTPGHLDKYFAASNETKAVFLVVSLFTYVTAEDVVRVDARLGTSAALPCPALIPPTGDRTVAAFWYKDDQVIPFYTVDARTVTNFIDGKHRQLSAAGHRSRFNVTVVPAILQFKVESLDDEGVYVCRVDFHRSLTRMSTVVLHVLAPTPKLVIMEGRRPLSGVIGPYKENSDLELTCEMTGSRSNSAQLIWYMDGSLIDASFKVLPAGILRNTLRIKNLQRRHLMSALTCTSADNSTVTPGPILATTIQLDILLRPSEVRIVPRYTAVRENSAVELWCTSRGSRPPPELTWWMSYSQLSNASVEDTGNATTSTLVLSVSADDHGKTVTCRAENRKLQNSTLTDNIALNVTFPPRVALSLKTYSSSSVSEGDTVALLCNVQANPPVYTVEWMFAKQYIPEASQIGAITSGLTLVLEKLEPRHKGSYRCKASNSEGEKESNAMWLAVRHRPVCQPGQQVSYGAKWGETLLIRCEVDAEPSLVAFHWSFANPVSRHRNISFVSRGLRSIATYTAKENRQLGSLFCWANNSAGEQYVPCTFTVYLPAKPNPVRECAFTNSTEYSVTIVCQPGYDGGAAQHFFAVVRNFLSSGSSFNMSSPIPAFTFTGLSPGITFRVTVIAANKMGYSDPVTIKVSTLEDELHKGRRKWTSRFNGIVLMTSLLLLMIFMASLIAYEAVKRHSRSQLI